MQIDISKYKAAEQFSSSKKEEKYFILDFLNKDIHLFGKKFSDKKKERFYSDLSILLSAGVDIKTTLELIIEEQTKAKDKQLYERIKDDVISGKSLSEAMNKTEQFSMYEYYSIRIGEESGKIAEVLNELSKYFTNKIKQSRQLVQALSYPIIVLLTAFGAIFFMMNFVVPMFADIFKRFKSDLPYLTKLIMKFSEIVSAYSGYFFVVVFAIIAVFYSQRKAEWFRKYGAMLIMKLPVIGDMIKKIYVARFCHSMNLLMSAKTPLVTAIDLVKKMIGFYPIEKSLDTVKEDILKGVSLHQSLSNYSIYNKRMISLIKVAEEVNQLDLIFEKLSKQYLDEVEHQTSIMSTLLEPFIIIFLGVFVAVILVAMYLPLFQLSTSVR